MLGSLIKGISSAVPQGAKSFISANKRHFNLFSGFHVASLGYGLYSAGQLPKEERLGAATKEIIINQIAVKYPGVGGIGVSLALAVGLESGNIIRGLSSMLRTGVEHRTMMAIPFSYANTGMIQANQAYQQAQRSMSGAYNSVNEAAMYASRYMQR